MFGEAFAPVLRRIFLTLLVASDFDPETIKPKRAYRRNRYFARNELSRLCLGVLRTSASDLLTTDAFIKRELRQRGCTYVKEYGTAALWKTRRKVHFSVPQEGPDKRTDEYTWDRLLKEIEQYL